MKIVILKKQDFVTLVRGYRKALYMVDFLTYLVDGGAVNDSYYNLKSASEVFGITSVEIMRAYSNNCLRGYNSKGNLMFLASDIIELKCQLYKLELDKILKQIVRDGSTLQNMAENKNG